MQISLTPEQFAAAAARIKAQLRINVTTPSGQLSSKGCTVTYIYDGASTLHINVLKRPFYCSEQHLEDQITAWFAGS